MNYKNIIDSPQGGFIFIGKKYSGLMKEAVYLAETIANKGVNGISFGVHPDIHIISIIDGKKKILLSQIEEIGEYENKYPIYADVNIFVIDNADTMTEDASSRLLKVLEDGYSNNCIIMVCSRRPIETICNRCCIISTDTMKKDDIVSRLSEKYKISEVIFNAISDVGTRTEILEQLDNEGMQWVIDCMKGLLNSNHYRELLVITGVIKEEKYFFKNLTKYQLLGLMYGYQSVMLDIMYNYTGCGLRVISKDMALRLLTFYSLDKVVKILQNINLAIEKIEKGVFTNNDLFLLVNNFAY